jgi:hypothetical protein
MHFLDIWAIIIIIIIFLNKTFLKRTCHLILWLVSKRRKNKKKKKKAFCKFSFFFFFFFFGFRLSGSAINQLKKAWEDKESRRNELKIKTKENFQQYEQEIPLKH